MKLEFIKEGHYREDDSSDICIKNKFSKNL